MNNLEVPVTPAKGAVSIPSGPYDATVASVEADEGEFGAQVKFIFRLNGETDDATGDPIELWAWSSLKVNPRTKLYKWISALTGATPVVGGKFDVGTLTGLPCRVLVNLEDGDEGPRARVIDVQGRKAAETELGVAS